MRAQWICLAVALTVPGCDLFSDDKDKPEEAAAGENGGAKAQGEGGGGGGNEGAAKAGLPVAEELLEKSVAAAGGRERVEAIDSFHFIGQVDAPALNITGKVETWWRGGDFFMLQSIEGIGTNKSGKQGDVIWTEEPINGLRKLSGQEAEQHAWASSLLLAADWKKHFAKAETVAERTENGKKVYDVKLTSDSGAELTLGVDAETNLVTSQSFTVVNPMGPTPVKMDLEDYREVDGIKIPFEQKSDLGVLKLSQKITKVELNVDVDPSRFAMPDSDTDVVKGDKEPEEPEADLTPPE